MKRAIVMLTTGLAATLVVACGSSTNTPTATASSSAPVATPTAPPATAAATPTPTAAATAAQVAGELVGAVQRSVQRHVHAHLEPDGGERERPRSCFSSPADTLNISGTLEGNAIAFGAVGVVAYTGVVNGNSMAGSYIDKANNQTGTWSATKS